MKKFSKLFEKQKAEIIEFNKKTISDLLKKHGELDIIARDNQRYFIAPHMHDNGKFEELGDGFQVLTKDGDTRQINYSDIIGIEF